MADAFASAPSPRVGLGGNDRDSGRMQAMQDDSMLMNDILGGSSAGVRIKIGMTKLHNPGGKVSYVGL